MKKTILFIVTFVFLTVSAFAKSSSNADTDYPGKAKQKKALKNKAVHCDAAHARGLTKNSAGTLQQKKHTPQNQQAVKLSKDSCVDIIWLYIGDEIIIIIIPCFDVRLK